MTWQKVNTRHRRLFSSVQFIGSVSFKAKSYISWSILLLFFQRLCLYPVCWLFRPHKIIIPLLMWNVPTTAAQIKKFKVAPRKVFSHVIKAIKYQKQPNLMNYQHDIPKNKPNSRSEYHFSLMLDAIHTLHCTLSEKHRIDLRQEVSNRKRASRRNHSHWILLDVSEKPFEIRFCFGYYSDE